MNFAKRIKNNNLILRQYPKIFKNVLYSENKQKYFHNSLKKLASIHKLINKQLKLHELFSDSFNSLSLRDAKDVKERSIEASDREEAIDEGEVKKERNY